MRIFNMRFGLATNSSSTHSLIFAPRANDRDADGQFGWDYFTVASEQARRMYAALILQSNMNLPDDAANTLVEAWAGVSPRGDDYVDHQSVYVLPQDWTGKCADREFFDEFLGFMLQPNLVVLGGNDNDDGEHPLDDGRSFVLPLPRDERSDGWVARKDPSGYWSCFNRQDGAKVRFSFDDLAAVPKKAAAPELVDVKITDYCPMGCAFCYQGSTPEGKHAERGWLESLAAALGEMRVFEVAIGGGEPTMHPHFLAILQAFRRAGVVPNFTTKSLAWLRKPQEWPAILGSAGAFAYSVDSAADVKALAALLAENDIDASKASVQYVMGTTELAELEAVLRAAAEADIRVTLLGYKTTGRGGDYAPKDYEGWLDVVLKVRKEYWSAIGVDTVLAAAYEPQLKAAGVGREFYTTEEGKFSAYIDAVEKKIGPSSYCDSGLMRPMSGSGHSGEHEKIIRSAFAQF